MDQNRGEEIADMTKTIDAMYENGVFRPVQATSLGITEGQRVRITVNDNGEPEALRLATQVYEGLSDQDIDEIEEIALDRRNFFGRRSDG
jgi:predicted DNA-binding antitoxin AbrB/MazE fold protein